MKERVINIQLRVQSMDRVTNAELLKDIRRCMEEITARGAYHAPWWPVPRDGVTVGFADLTEQLRAERGEPCSHCGAVGSACQCGIENV